MEEVNRLKTVPIICSLKIVELFCWDVALKQEMNLKQNNCLKIVFDIYVFGGLIARMHRAYNLPLWEFLVVVVVLLLFIIFIRCIWYTNHYINKIAAHSWLWDYDEYTWAETYIKKYEDEKRKMKANKHKFDQKSSGKEEKKKKENE